jgi:hypothetical protein
MWQPLPPPPALWLRHAPQGLRPLLRRMPLAMLSCRCCLLAGEEMARAVPRLSAQHVRLQYW